MRTVGGRVVKLCVGSWTSNNFVSHSPCILKMFAGKSSNIDDFIKHMLLIGNELLVAEMQNKWESPTLF